MCFTNNVKMLTWQVGLVTCILCWTARFEPQSSTDLMLAQRWAYQRRWQHPLIISRTVRSIVTQLKLKVVKWTILLVLVQCRLLRPLLSQGYLVQYLCLNIGVVKIMYLYFSFLHLWRINELDRSILNTKEMDSFSRDLTSPKSNYVLRWPNTATTTATTSKTRLGLRSYSN